MSDDSAGEFDELAWAGCFHGKEEMLSKEDIARSRTNAHLDLMELHALKRRAAELYFVITRFDSLTCTQEFAAYLCEPMVAAYAKLEFTKIWARVRELDPLAPPSPFDEEEEG